MHTMPKIALRATIVVCSDCHLFSLQSLLILEEADLHRLISEVLVNLGPYCPNEGSEEGQSRYIQRVMNAPS